MSALQPLFPFRVTALHESLWEVPPETGTIYRCLNTEEHRQVLQRAELAEDLAQQREALADALENLLRQARGTVGWEPAAEQARDALRKAGR